MTDDQIKHITNRFLAWRLPENFNPDAGISFKPNFNEHTAHPMKHEPVGTNLFDAQQAEAMIRYMTEGLPAARTAALGSFAVAMILLVMSGAANAQTVQVVPVASLASTVTDVMQVLTGIAALLTSLGITGAAVRYFQAKGVDIKATLNNQFVQAALNGAHGLIKDLEAGKSLSDPAVLSSLTTSLASSLAASHDATIAKIGATPADVLRVASNAVGAVVPSVAAKLGVLGEPVAMLSSLADAPAAPPSIGDAIKVISEARTALATLATMPVIAAPSPAMAPVS